MAGLSRNLFVLGLGLLQLIALTYGQPQTCNSTLLACTANLAQNYTPFTFPPTSLPTFCSVCDTTYTCAVSAGCQSSYTSSSGTSDGSTWRTWYPACSRLCSPSGQQAYTQYQSCIFSAAYTAPATAFMYCLDQTNVKYPQNTPIANNMMMCLLTNDAIGCYLYGIQKTCTNASIANGAMTFMLNYLTSVTLVAAGPTLTGCTLNGKSDVVTWTIPTVSPPVSPPVSGSAAITAWTTLLALATLTILASRE